MRFGALADVFEAGIPQIEKLATAATGLSSMSGSPLVVITSVLAVESDARGDYPAMIKTNGYRTSDGTPILAEPSFLPERQVAYSQDGKPFLAYMCWMRIVSAYRGDPRALEVREMCRRDQVAYREWYKANGPEIEIEIVLTYGAGMFTEEQARKQAALDVVAELKERGFEAVERWWDPVLFL